MNLRLMTSPSETARLASTSETMPAARLVIQKRWGVALVAKIISQRGWLSILLTGSVARGRAA